VAEDFAPSSERQLERPSGTASVEALARALIAPILVDTR
jgi:hypothetical protein